jgi:hypothetical protein
MKVKNNCRRGKDEKKEIREITDLIEDIKRILEEGEGERRGKRGRRLKVKY